MTLPTRDALLGPRRAGAGSWTAIAENAAAASRAACAAAAFRDAADGALRRLRSSAAASVSAVEDLARTRILPNAESARSDWAAVGRALHAYARQVASLRARERDTIALIDEGLGALAALAAETASACGARPAGPGGWRRFPVDAAAGLDAAVHGRAQAGELAVLRSRWQRAVTEVEAHLQRHRGLVRERDDADAACARAISATTAGIRVHAFGALAGSVTIAITGVRPSREGTRATLGMLLAAGTPSQARRVWRSLTGAERIAAIGADPALVSSRAGVDLADRVLASRQVAIAEHRRLRTLDAPVPEQQIAYLKRVAEGRVSLVSYQPGGDRIIEMIGAPGASTRHALIYLPGTGAAQSGFWSGETSRVARALTEEGAGSVVAFVYKDRPWISWTGAGATTANLDEPGLSAIGKEVAEFVSSLRADPALPSDAVFDGIGHSAGLSVLAASETAGARYATVTSLSGSALPAGWTPNPGTAYAHHQYDTDFINSLDYLAIDASTGRYGPNESMPHMNDAFTQSVVDDGVPVPRPIENHGRSADGPERNPVIIDAVAQWITTQGGRR